jgi:CheY-like chemotaxis protein
MADVLIVDDQANIRRLLSVTLGREFSLVEADNGLAALAMIRQHKPRVVLLDVMMAGQIDGLQVLDAIKIDPSTASIAVAMVSARGQQDDIETARRRGADAYFVKPFSPMQVVNWVRDHLS